MFLTNQDNQETILQQLYDRIDSVFSKGDKIVFTDLDGTLYRDSLYLNIYYKLCERGILSREAIEAYDEKRLSWKNREIDYDEFLYETLEFYTKESINIHRDDFESVIREIIKNDFDRIYVSTKKLIEGYQKAGYKVFIVSGSPDIIVREFARYMGYSIGIGTLETINEDGFFTGDRFVMAKNENKLLMVNYVLDNFSPSETVGFGDTTGDLGMLKLMDLGYCINPPRDLYDKILEESSINVIIERKNLSLVLDKSARKLVKII